MINHVIIMSDEPQRLRVRLRLLRVFKSVFKSLRQTPAVALPVLGPVVALERDMDICRPKDHTD